MSTTTTPETVQEALAAGPLGATLCFPQDRYGYVVVRASKTGTVLTLQRLVSVNTATGHKPDRYDGPWPVWDHLYTPEEMASMAEEGEFRATWSEKRQCYRLHGTPVHVGHARYYRNYSY